MKNVRSGVFIIIFEHISLLTLVFLLLTLSRHMFAGYLAQIQSLHFVLLSYSLLIVLVYFLVLHWNNVILVTEGTTWLVVADMIQRKFF